MRVDASQLPLRNETEVCVVGAGPAGLTVALTMARQGHRVLVLESGHDDFDAEQRRQAAGDCTAHPYPRLESTRARGVGGSALIWPSSALRCRPLDPADFEARSDVGREGWPIAYDSIRSYIDDAQRLCGLPTDYSPELWGGPDKRLDVDDELIETQVFMFVPGSPWAKKLADSVEAQPNVQLVTNATVTNFRLNDVGARAESVTFVDRGGRELVVRPRVTVLAAGGIDNAKLLLSSTLDRPAGLGNAYDQVGRYFMEHPHLSTGYVQDQRLLHRIGMYQHRQVNGTEVLGYVAPTPQWRREHGALASSWKLGKSTTAVVSPAGRSLHGIGQALRHRRWPPPPHTFERVTTALRHPVDAVNAALGHYRGSGEDEGVIRLYVMSEQEPNPSSRVVLSSKRDNRGAPRAELQWRLTELDRHTIRSGQECLDTGLRAAGFDGVQDFFGEEVPPAHIGNGAHHMGTTRMHADPRHGVVDRDCRLHEVNDLYVAGSSVFTTSGSANPTITLLALALRLADHLDRRLSSDITSLSGDTPSD